MDQKLRADADQIISAALAAVSPDEAVRRALAGKNFPGRVLLVAVGKAGWQMAKAAAEVLERLDGGIVVTKYGHVMGAIPNVTCLEAGHPVPDEGSFRATDRVLDMVRDLKKEDTVVLLLSGGGSALFEKPLIDADELQSVTEQLLKSGADIVEMNTIRKRLSAVKGGRFALHCAPARVFGIALSDVLGDVPDMIASGPASPDPSTCQQAKQIAEKYGLQLSEKARHALEQETPKALPNARLCITGSVRALAAAAAEKCEALGYETVILTDQLCCEARQAGQMLSEILQSHAADGKKLAFVAGGETVVRVTGSGKGGRNQEVALAAAEGIAELAGAAVFSVGSDGTDGPTDAAGGYADSETAAALAENGLEISAVLAENDAYHALKAVGGLIFTGPTGTNVNDVAVALLDQSPGGVSRPAG